MSQATTHTEAQYKTELDHVAPTPEALLRIYEDARVWLNVARDREIGPGARIDEDELLAQLEAEGYSKSEAAGILDRAENRDELSRTTDGVVPVVLNVTVEEAEVSA
jgi:hypothetical protein